MNNVLKTLTTILVLLCSFIANAAWTVRYQHTDTLGSVIAESNSQGTITQRFDYKPFGEGTPTQKAGVGYTGHLEDTDLGLTYMQQRYYDPVIGRFYSNDPIGFRDTHSFNRYAYANNNPYKYIDPTGMATDLGFCGVSGCDYSYKSGDSSSSDEDRKHYGQKNSKEEGLPATYTKLPNTVNPNGGYIGEITCGSDCVAFLKINDAFHSNQTRVFENVSIAVSVAVVSEIAVGRSIAIWVNSSRLQRQLMAGVAFEVMGIGYSITKTRFPMIKTPPYTEASFVMDKKSKYLKPKMRVPANND